MILPCRLRRLVLSCVLAPVAFLAWVMIVVGEKKEEGRGKAQK